MCHLIHFVVEPRICEVCLPRSSEVECFDHAVICQDWSLFYVLWT